MIGRSNQRTFQLAPGIDRAFAGPSRRTTNDHRSDTFMPPRVFDDMFCIQAGGGCHTARHTFLFQHGKARFDVRPIRPGRIGQYFQLGFDPTTQRSAHFKQTLHRRDRTQGNDDATFHGVFSEPRATGRANATRLIAANRSRRSGPDRARRIRFAAGSNPARWPNAVFRQDKFVAAYVSW